ILWDSFLMGSPFLGSLLRKIIDSQRDVALYLRPQLVDRREFDLVAYSLVERNLDVLAVQPAVVVDDVSLAVDMRRSVVDGRTHADVRDSEEYVVGNLDRAGVDAVFRDHVSLGKFLIYRRYADCASELLAVYDRKVD